MPPARQLRGQGKTMAKRHQKQEKSGVQHITSGDIRRMARRGGVKRIASEIYPTTRETIVNFLTQVVKDSVIYSESANRSTVFALDVVYALKRVGRNLLLNVEK